MPASVSSVLTQGYGSYGGTDLVLLLGYGVGAEVSFVKVCFCDEAFVIPEFSSERSIVPEFSDEETILPEFSSESFLTCDC